MGVEGSWVEGSRVEGSWVGGSWVEGRWIDLGVTDVAALHWLTLYGVLRVKLVLGRAYNVLNLVFYSITTAKETSTMPDPKHESITSSAYSGHTDSVATATEQTVKKNEGERMMSSAESAKAKRRENKAAAAARREEEAKQK